MDNLFSANQIAIVNSSSLISATLFLYILASPILAAGKSSAADHQLQYYVQGLDNAINIHEAFKKEQREIRKAYQIYMKLHNETTLAWNEGQLQR